MRSQQRVLHQVFGDVGVAAQADGETLRRRQVLEHELVEGWPVEGLPVRRQARASPGLPLRFVRSRRETPVPGEMLKQIPEKKSAAVMNHRGRWWQVPQR